MVNIRKEQLATDEVYHIFSRSIAKYKIFNNRSEFYRMLNALQFYQFYNIPIKLSRFIESAKTLKYGFRERLLDLAGGTEKQVEIIAYCLMPSHIHLILEQLQDDGITIFMNNSLNSYSRYFNLKHGRKGPLWESTFKNVLISSDKQLLHLTRYIHLNPVTAHLVEKTQDWDFSSYKEYMKKIKGKNKICVFDDLLDIDPKEYQKFVNDRKDYQRELAQIKNLLIEKA